MILIQLISNIFLSFTGVLVIVLDQRSILLILMFIYLDDVYEQIFSLFILIVAAAESAIGLAILILYYSFFCYFLCCTL